MDGKEEKVTGIGPFLDEMKKLDHEDVEKKEKHFSFIEYMEQHPPVEMNSQAWDQMLTDSIVDFIRGMDDVRNTRGLPRWTEGDLVSIIHGMFNGRFVR